MPILLVTHKEKSSTGRFHLVTSHGVDLNTGRTVITSQDSPDRLGARFDPEIGEWILDDAKALA